MTHLRPLSFGEILDGAFSSVRRHIVPMAATACLPLLLLAAGTVVMASSMPTGDDLESAGAGMAITMLFFLLSLPVTALALAALTRQASQAWIGGEVSVADGMRAARASWLRMAGAMVVSVVAAWLLMVALMVPLGILGAIFIPALAGGGSGGAAMVGIVVLLVVALPVVLGIYLVLFSSLACLPAAVVLEGLGPIRSLRRSLALASGARLRTGAVLLVAAIISFLPLLVVMFLTGSLAAFTQPGAVPPVGTLVVQQLASAAVWIVAYPFLLSVSVLVYYDRRVRVEALDVAMAAEALPSHFAPNR